MPDLICDSLPDYQLLDSGQGEKLERIAGVLVQRPCSQAIWPKCLPAKRWKQANSVCRRSDDGGGSWQHHAGEPKKFSFQWQGRLPQALRLQLRFTSFGHCGVFVEHSSLWQYVLDRGPRRFLNLFGYTGAASLAVAGAGAEVFHVDSAKGVLDWGKESQALNAWLPGSVRWIHDDARASLAFSKKRGFQYDVVLMDPPSWGHGKTSKEVWEFDRDCLGLVQDGAAVLAPGGALVFSCHTPGVQVQAVVNVLRACGLVVSDAGELGVRHHEDERVLPAGLYAVGERRAS